MRIARASFLMLLLAAPQLAHATPESEVGVTAAVNTVATGIPPVQPEHILFIGSEIVHNERIVTDSQGQTQLLFRDGSTFTVGENANVVIDEFVFDPETTKGKLALSVTQGAFRFVGGKLSKDGSVEIATPAAVLGVRGGIITGQVSETGETTASLHFGQSLTVTGRGGQVQTVIRPGFEVAVASVGAAPQAPRRTTAAEVVATVAHLVGKTTASGGAATKPTAPQVVQALNAPSTPGAAPAKPSQIAKTATPTKQVSAPKTVIIPPVVTKIVQDTKATSKTATTKKK
jgi:trimeric autotransporter adhesin